MDRVESPVHFLIKGPRVSCRKLAFAFSGLFDAARQADESLEGNKFMQKTRIDVVGDRN